VTSERYEVLTPSIAAMRHGGPPGLGRRHGADGTREYAEIRTVAVQRFMPLGPSPKKAVGGFVRRTGRQPAPLRLLGVR
jgi:succinate-semialdehyde dehydrogenase/glutarate-semialdehyde dehydrogenase